MARLDYAIKRLLALKGEISRLQKSEFPYSYSLEALTLLEKVVRQAIKNLAFLDPGKHDPKILKDKCAHALTLINNCLPLLGFILRSTNVRISFEVFSPLHRLARTVLGDDVRLILSSEWLYSPHIYPEIRALPGFVLIGFPAHESGNPLLIPLAGHELGHHVWPKIKDNILPEISIREQLATIIKSQWADFKGPLELLDKSPDNLTEWLFFHPISSMVSNWVSRQCEETFCDFFALGIFGKSYLYAFAYLLSPKFNCPRSVNYPNMKVRAQNLVTAAGKLGIEVPSGYSDMFEDLPIPDNLSKENRFLLLNLADKALEDFIPKLINAAKDKIKKLSAAKASKDSERIFKRFENAVPAENCKNITDILNAAWRAYENEDFWKKVKQLRKKKDKVLKNLVLKTFEVFEYEQRVRSHK